MMINPINILFSYLIFYCLILWKLPKSKYRFEKKESNFIKIIHFISFGTSILWFYIFLKFDSFFLWDLLNYLTICTPILTSLIVVCFSLNNKIEELYHFFISGVIPLFMLFILSLPLIGPTVGILFSNNIIYYQDENIIIQEKASILISESILPDVYIKNGIWKTKINSKYNYCECFSLESVETIEVKKINSNHYLINYCEYESDSSCITELKF